MNKVLFIGDANSFLVIQLVKWIDRCSDLEVEILHTYNSPVSTPEIYSKVYSFHIWNFLIKVPYYGRYRKTRMINRLLKRNPFHYRYAHIHAAKRVYSGIIKELKKKTEKIILTIWGSDFNQVTDKVKKQLLPLLRQTDIITFANVELRDVFFNYYQVLDWNKSRIIKFGLHVLEIIKDNDKEQEWIKEYFGIPKDRVVITIGSNGSPNQQHLTILNTLINDGKLKGRKDQLIFLLPFTYGGSEAYLARVNKMLSKSCFRYILFKDYLSDKEVAWLRVVSDVMIQLQNYDQFSGSMQEYLYAGNVVITGSWLPYEEMKKAGIYFKEVNSVLEIGKRLNEVLENLEIEKKRGGLNKEIIYSISSWNNNIEKWLSLYNE